MTAPSRQTWGCFLEYARFGAGWPGDGPLRRAAGVSSVHTRLRSLRLMLAIESEPLPDDVLEVGFGEGYLLLALARRHPKASFEGWEVDAGHVAAASRRAAAARLDNARFLRTGESGAPDSRTGAFGLIYSADVLEHVPDDAALLASMRARLAPGGRILAHVPKRRSLQRRFFRKFAKHTDPGHVREEYTLDELVAKAGQAGLTVTRSWPAFGPVGELAFELNSLGWPNRAADRIVRLLSLPVVLPLGLLDLAHQGEGNSLLVEMRPAAS